MPIANPEVYAAMLDAAKQGSFAYPAINVTPRRP
jgi:fructose-bisphosphate aldolase, class II